MALSACLLPTAVTTAEADAPCFYSDGAQVPEPGFSEAAMHAYEFGPQLKASFDALSDGEVSTVVALLEHPGSTLLTMKCSANDVFWTHLSLVGLSDTSDDAVPADLAGKARGYRVTEEGQQLLPGLIDGLVRERYQ